MATTRKVNCREHAGGKFIAPPRRGRPPVRCGDGFRCTAYTTAITAPPKTKPTRKALAAERAEFDREDAAVRTKVREANRLKASIEANASKPVTDVHTEAEVNAALAQASLAKAKRAKEELTAVGWTVEGRAKGERAEITAIRDAEMLVMVWDKGNLIASNYSLWATDRPRENGMPQPELSFDPSMMSDRELVRALAGMPVVWWNRLGQTKERAVISNRQITIQQVYDEKAIRHGADPSDRILTFVDMDGTGYKSLRLSQLLKVGN